MSTADDIISEFGYHQCGLCGTECVAVCDQIDALTVQCDALRAALRKHAMYDRSDCNDYFMQCDECGECWTKGEAEEHATGCLAAAEDAPKGG